MIVATTTLLIELWFLLPVVAVSAILSAKDSGSRINVRSAPTTESSSPHYGLSGDIEVLRQTKAKDGYTWYYVKFYQSGAEGWVRADLIRISSNNSKAKIADGNYGIGLTDLGLQVKGNRYQYYDEVGNGSWMPISKLQYDELPRPTW
ncbi:SH3 domain-containing protein [Tolypothrix sp. VBCCA 56010]|uniref:SH3 domain-containing protein n=1 Tax=Tolypothrix sp. VBCCA 56010 TaxID=3137731 RepID=UPI003D7E64D5